MVTRSAAIASANEYFDSGDFLMDLTRRVAFRTESGVADHRPDLFAYLEHAMVPAANRLGANARVLESLVNGQGEILVPGLRPPSIPDSVRRALRTIPVGGDPGDPDIDEDGGEPGLTPGERVIGWSTRTPTRAAPSTPLTSTSSRPSRGRRCA